MSIERRQRLKGTVWIVRWREVGGFRSRTFDRKRDADAFDAKLRLAKRRGGLEELDAGRQSLREFLDEWWRLYAEHHLTGKTLKLYAGFRDRYLFPRLGDFELRRITPEMVQRLQVDLAREGVGQETIRKTLALLQGVLERAVEWGHLQANPVRVIRKPPQTRRRSVRPLAPATVEAIRGRLLRGGRKRDAVLVSVLAYAGLRPGEALALRWSDIRDSVLLIERALALGELQGTKTRRSRTVRILRPLAADLAEWRMASGRPDEASLVFPMRDGRPWTDTAYRNWRKRVYVPAAESVGIEQPRPYDLRHSLASLLFAEGMNPAEIAEQMGHSLQTLLGTYTHVIAELRGQKRRSAEMLIRHARETSRATSVPHEAR